MVLNNGIIEESLKFHSKQTTSSLSIGVSKCVGLYLTLVGWLPEPTLALLPSISVLSSWELQQPIACKFYIKIMLSFVEFGWVVTNGGKLGVA